MNLELLRELDDRLRHIRAVLEGQQSGNADVLLQKLLDRAAAAAGRESPEYGLALRARASVYRSRGELRRATAEYSRAAELLERAGDEGLIQLVEALTSMIRLYTQLKEPGEASKAARRATEFIARYAREPDGHVPTKRPEGGPAREADAEEDSAFAPAEHVAARLARGVADALVDRSVDEGVRVFDELLKVTSDRLVMQLSILLGRASFEAAHGKEQAARDTFSRAWALAHPSGEAADFVLPRQWGQLGQLALRCGLPNEALKAARQLRELQPTSDDTEFLSYRYQALRLEAAVCDSGDDPVAAEQSLRRLHEFCASTFGRDAEETVEAESQLGRLLVDLRRPGEAVMLLRHAANVRVRSPTHPDARSADALFDLGYCLDRNGDDTEAIAYYADAYRIYQRVWGPEAPTTVLAALNLAETARAARDYETAERWFRVVLSAERQARGEQTARLALALNNLAETLLALDRADEAAPLAEQALAIREELFGKQSSEYDRSLAVVAQVALKRGDLERVSVAATQATSPSGKIKWPVDLAASYLELRGDYEQAIKIYEQAIERLATTGQEENASLLPGQQLTFQFKLAELQAHLGRWADAKCHLLSAFKSERIFLSDECGHRSRRQIGLLLDESRKRITALLAVLSHDPDATPDDVHAAYLVIQQRKGMETRLLRLQKPSFVINPALNALRPGMPDRLQAVHQEMDRQVERLRRAREEWVWALIRQAQQAEPGPEGLSVAALQDRVELRERQLASFIGQGARDHELVGFTSTTPVVPKGAAVVEYVLAEGPAPAYYAFVIRRDWPVQMRWLGDAAPIHQALTQLRTQVIDGLPPRPNNPDPGWRRRARFLTNRLLKPLLDLLEDAERLYVVPDAELFTLPFDLLPLDEDRLAIDRWTITHLWHGGELLGFNAFLGWPETAAQPVVVSAPALAGDASSEPAAEDQTRAWRFAPLPFADREGEAVAGKIGATHLRGPAATKDAVLACSGAEILHFATHSFYIARAPGTTPAAPRGGPDTLLFRARSVLAEPMERSGIALTGADRELNATTASSPGILFGAEVLDLDLRGTDLTVLSSCQSGLGDPHPGDGIQGLRRAFRAAGARTVVSSLWKVPDEATYDFMMMFYDRLLSQMPRGQALREAKLALRKQYSNDPLFWAGFVLDGSDRPLFRFDPVFQRTFTRMSGIDFSYDLALEDIAQRRWEDAIKRLDLVLESPTADAELRAAAGYERAGILRKTGRLEEALAAYDALIHNLDTPAKRQRYAVADRGLTKQLLGDLDGAYLDYTSVLNAADLPDEARARLLVNRASVLGLQHNWEMAIADCDEVLSRPGSPPEQRLKALLNRADLHRQQGEYPEATADATALAEMPESAGSSERANAYLILALCHLEEGRLPAAIANVRRHLEERVTSPSPTAADTLTSCVTLLGQDDAKEASSQLYRLIAELTH